MSSQRDDQTIRILVWSPYGASVMSGGAGLNAGRLYATRSTEHIEVTLAHGSKDHPDASQFDRVIFLRHLTKPSNPLNHIIFLIYSVIWLVINRNRYDVFHGIDTFEATITPAIVAKRLGMQVVVKPASIRSGTNPTRSWRRLFGRPARRAKHMSALTRIISISSSITEHLVEVGIPESKIVNIPNGVDVERFTPVTEDRRQIICDELNLNREAFNILCVCGIRPVKRLEWLIKAVAEISLDQRVIELHIVGPEPNAEYRNALNALISELGVQSKVMFHPKTQTPEDYYRVADLFCLVSSYEGLSNALLEAMASALPVIATPVSGSIDLIDDRENGLIVSSVAELTMGIETIYTDKRLARDIGEKARNTVTDRYSRSYVWQRHVNLFSEIFR